MSYQGPGDYGQQGPGADPSSPYYVPPQNYGSPPNYGSPQNYGPPPNYGSPQNYGSIPDYARPSNDSYMADAVLEAMAAKALAERYAANGGGSEPRRRRRHPFRTILLLLLLILIAGGIYQFAIPHAGNPFTPASTTTITTSAHPRLIIDSSTYTEKYKDPPIIKVRAGTTQTSIVLKPSNPEDVPYDQTTDKGTVVVNMDMLSQETRAGGTLEVTVPTTTDLTIDSNSATIDISGITGHMLLTSNGGLITVANSTITGPALLAANSGDITLKQDTVNGQVTFNNNSGTITANQANLSGKVSFINNTGKTIFDGTMAAQGNYEFQNNTGSISCTLPTNVGLHVDATTNGGTITSNDATLPVQNNELHADLGGSPRAQVTLTNNTGAINVLLQKGR